MEKRGTEKFCPHVAKASQAFHCKQFAPTEAIDIQEVAAKVCDEVLEKSLMNESSDGDLTVYKLPGGNIAVPSLDMFSSRTCGPFIHVRDSKCQLESCSKKTKSKKHTLLEKGVPLCPHSMLGKEHFVFKSKLYAHLCEEHFSSSNIGCFLGKC